MKSEPETKIIKNSKSTNLGCLHVLLIMALIILAGTMFSGGFIPVNPNGPGGPPTLPPYFGIDGTQEEQKIIYPSDALSSDAKGNIQLKTFKVNICAQKSAVDILIDTSGSMADDNKIGKLKDALKSFTQNLSPKSAISIQTFSGVVTEKVPWGLYKNNKTQVDATIDNLNADGWTRMQDGFILAKQKLTEAKTQNKFPGYNYNLLLISDGVPEIPPPDGTFPHDPIRCAEPNYDPPPPGDTRKCYVRVCDPRTAPALRCFVKDQDPRIPVNLPDEIKNMGVPIYSIGLYSNITSDNKLRAYLEPLLEEISSKPLSGYYYAYNSAANDNAENLKRIFDNIISKICEEQFK